ncbi:hypothetical protein JW711_06040 [Candidatus Woesearchaeota archaeon]|nr:hypothetical protein [Candidatus Woesearchaeota archaeon]
MKPKLQAAVDSLRSDKPLEELVAVKSDGTEVSLQEFFLTMAEDYRKSSVRSKNYDLGWHLRLREIAMNPLNNLFTYEATGPLQDKDALKERLEDYAFGSQKEWCDFSYNGSLIYSAVAEYEQATKPQQRENALFLFRGASIVSSALKSLGNHERFQSYPQTAEMRRMGERISNVRERITHLAHNKPVIGLFERLGSFFEVISDQKLLEIENKERDLQKWHIERESLYYEIQITLPRAKFLVDQLGKAYRAQYLRNPTHQMALF